MILANVIDRNVWGYILNECLGLSTEDNKMWLADPKIIQFLSFYFSDSDIIVNVTIGMFEAIF